MQSGAFLFPTLVIIIAQGCSFSESSTSSSGNSGSSSESSTSLLSSQSSSSSEEDEEKYQLAILNYTSAYINSSKFNHVTYTRGISEIATANGITSWEEDEATLTAIGRGLKNSNITGSLYETYRSNIANSSENRMQMIQKGYDMQ
ncbi:MAG: putative lipoprotein [Methyloprofundus sp.]|nr:putative lipoprotein [Methyloprofundus sp.]